MIKLLFLLAIFFQFSTCQVDWFDCGDPFDKPIRFTSLTVAPNPIVTGGELNFAITATVSSLISSARLHVQAIWFDQTVLTLTQIDLCDFSDSVTCPISSGEFSFAEVVTVPTMPAGDYAIQVSVHSEVNDDELGCVGFTIPVSNPTSECEYTSSYSVDLIGNQVAEVEQIGNRNVGNWLQVGPVGTLSPIFARSSAEFGTFENLAGTQDLLSTDPPTGFALEFYVWGISAILSERKIDSAGNLEHRYMGELFLGYSAPVNETSWITEDRALATGNIDWTFQYARGEDGEFTFRGVTGTLEFDPISSQPPGWRFPTSFGRLNGFNFAVTGSQGDRFAVEGSKTFCSCSVDACGNCGPTEEECIIEPLGSESDSFDDVWIVVIVVIVLILFIVCLIVAIAFMYAHRNDPRSEKSKKQEDPSEAAAAGHRSYRKAARSVEADEDVLLPPIDEDVGTFDSKNKPNYGLMALSDVLAEQDN